MSTLTATELVTRKREHTTAGNLNQLACRIAMHSPDLYPGPWTVRDEDGRHVATIRNGAIYLEPTPDSPNAEGVSHV